MAGGRPPLEVSASTSARSMSSVVDDSSTDTPVTQGNGSSAANINVWLSREADEQLRQAIEMSELLTTSTSTPLCHSPIVLSYFNDVITHL